MSITSVEELFQNTSGACEVVQHLSENPNAHTQAARDFLMEYWPIFKPYADTEFLSEMQRNLHQRFWEMYLTCSMLIADKSVESADSGPDIKVITDSTPIWIEAIAVTPGQEGQQDTVQDHISDPLNGECRARYVPDRQISLRYTSALYSEYNLKYLEQYRVNETVAENEPYLIAINGGSIPLAKLERGIPRIVQVLFGMGHEVVTIDTEIMGIVDTRHEHRPLIYKINSSSVCSSWFSKPENKYLSAVIFSTVDIFNQPPRLGEDLLIVHNPNAVNPVPHGFLGCGREFVADDEKVWEVINE